MNFLVVVKSVNVSCVFNIELLDNLKELFMSGN